MDEHDDKIRWTPSVSGASTSYILGMDVYQSDIDALGVSVGLWHEGGVDFKPSVTEMDWGDVTSLSSMFSGSSSLSFWLDPLDVERAFVYEFI